MCNFEWFIYACVNIKIQVIVILFINDLTQRHSCSVRLAFCSVVRQRIIKDDNVMQLIQFSYLHCISV